METMVEEVKGVSSYMKCRPDLLEGDVKSLPS